MVIEMYNDDGGLVRVLYEWEGSDLMIEKRGRLAWYGVDGWTKHC